MIRRPTKSNTWHFFSTSRSVDCDRKKRFLCRRIIYEDLLLHLHQTLVENNSSTVINKYILLYNSIYRTPFYVVMWHQILYFFLQNLLMPLLLFANKERSSSERRMGDGIADETSMHLPLSVDALARLLKNNHRRGYTRA